MAHGGSHLRSRRNLPLFPLDEDSAGAHPETRAALDAARVFPRALALLLGCPCQCSRRFGLLLCSPRLAAPVAMAPVSGLLGEIIVTPDASCGMGSGRALVIVSTRAVCVADADGALYRARRRGRVPQACPADAVTGEIYIYIYIWPRGTRFSASAPRSMDAYCFCPSSWKMLVLSTPGSTKPSENTECSRGSGGSKQ